jgi:hypothetical protein
MLCRGDRRSNRGENKNSNILPFNQKFILIIDLAMGGNF